MSEYIKMHGPAFDGSGKTAETNVHTDNVQAFERAGWKQGAMAGAAPKETTSTTPTRCGFMLKSGKQCAKDAVKGSEFCSLKSHK